MFIYEIRLSLVGSEMCIRDRSRTVSDYRSLLFKFWTLRVFEPPLGGLGTMYDVHLGLIGKRPWT